jgi:hypothetical protein
VFYPLFYLLRAKGGGEPIDRESVSSPVGPPREAFPEVLGCYDRRPVAIVKSNPLRLQGPWAAGYVLERQHTLSSEFLGHDSYGRPNLASRIYEIASYSP